MSYMANQKKDKHHKTHLEYLRLAFELAKINLGSTKENPSVGCVLVKNDKKWNFSRRVLIGDFNKRENGFSNYNVKTSTLDTFVRKKKIKYIDICKVDIEGSELDFLKGSKKTLKQNKIKILAIEVLDNKKKFIKKEKQIIALLKKNNRYFDLLEIFLNFKPIIFLSSLNDLR